MKAIATIKNKYFKFFANYLYTKQYTNELFRFSLINEKWITTPRIMLLCFIALVQAYADNDITIQLHKSNMSLKMKQIIIINREN